METSEGHVRHACLLCTLVNILHMNLVVLSLIVTIRNLGIVNILVELALVDVKPKRVIGTVMNILRK
jgi:hypothetical protein